MFYQTVDYLAECAIIEISKIQRKVLEMNYHDLPVDAQDALQHDINEYWGRDFRIDKNGRYGSDCMVHGYVTVNERTQEAFAIDCTPDDGDTLISIVRF